ncbi:transmembrane signal receptor [Lithospermum erythrorhizon]|uniref:Transmembrane signal receptor n=1 Tax=Lithospermum erythrorhizon TaxID=34254 RepID=A0AAV3QFA9_LITER
MKDLVHVLSQFSHEPCQEHWSDTLRVVKYLKGCPGQGILLKADCDLHLTGWCDSYWASCLVTRHFVSGCIVFLGHSPISWKTKKQVTVSPSSAEAEYRSMDVVTCELKWLKGLLQGLGVSHTRPMGLYCDSQSALYLL